MTDPSSRRVWQLVDTIGPVFSNLGLRNWDLCLAREAVIACPRSLWITVKAGLWAGLGSQRGMQRAWGSAATRAGPRALQDEGDSAWRRYDLGELDSITVRRSATSANEIRITRQGERPHVYGLGDRDQTDRCRAVLWELYGRHYREENF